MNEQLSTAQRYGALGGRPKKKTVQQLAEEVHALSVLKQETGFQCRRAVVELLENLSTSELVEVSKIVAAMSASQGATNNNEPRK